jgi:hypothetical protein
MTKELAGIRVILITLEPVLKLQLHTIEVLVRLLIALVGKDNERTEKITNQVGELRDMVNSGFDVIREFLNDVK